MNIRPCTSLTNMFGGVAWCCVMLEHYPSVRTRLWYKPGGWGFALVHRYFPFKHVKTAYDCLILAIPGCDAHRLVLTPLSSTPVLPSSNATRGHILKLRLYCYLYMLYKLHINWGGCVHHLTWFLHARSWTITVEAFCPPNLCTRAWEACQISSPL